MKRLITILSVVAVMLIAGAAQATVQTDSSDFAADTTRYFAPQARSAKLLDIYRDWTMTIWRAESNPATTGFDPNEDYVPNNALPEAAPYQPADFLWDGGSHNGNYKPQPYYGPAFWASGVGNAFTIAYDKATGKVDFSMTDQNDILRSGTWTHTANENLPINQMVIYLNVSDSATGCTFTLSNLSFLSEAGSLLPVNMSDSNTLSGSFARTRIYTDAAAGFGNFTLTGIATPVWGIDGAPVPTAGSSWTMKVSLGQEVCLFVLAGDLNNDCKVDFMDLKVLPEQWLQPPGLPSADIWPSGGDDMVNFEDFSVMAESWLIDCQANPANPACVPK